MACRQFEKKLFFRWLLCDDDDDMTINGSTILTNNVLYKKGCIFETYLGYMYFCVYAYITFQ